MYWAFYCIGSLHDFNNGTFKPISHTRILGVLQRIALCYFIASVVIRYTSKTFLVAFSVLLLVAYWIHIGIYGDPNDPYSLAGYAGNALDFMILGKNHLYHGEVFRSDPEGILSTLPAIVNVNRWLPGWRLYTQTRQQSYETIARLLMVGAVLIAVAMAWNTMFPINKKIWTSSFVLLTVGLDLVIFTDPYLW